MLKNEHQKRKMNSEEITSILPSQGNHPRSHRSILSVIRIILCASMLGILFGFLMSKSMIFVAPTIRWQMLFRGFSILKVFLAAVGVSMLSVAIVTLCRKASYENILNDYIENNNHRGILHYIFGGSLIGIGMVISGSCPGTVFVQVGSGIVNSLFICLGGLLGTYFYYALVHERISKEKLSSSSIFLRRISDLLQIHSVIVHVVLGLLLLGSAIGLEFIIPWRSDLNRNLIPRSRIDPDRSLIHVLELTAWPPSICGAGVGLLQLFFLFFLEKSLGVSSAFTVIAAQICRIPIIGRVLPSLQSSIYGLKNYTAIVFALGAIVGSALSSSLSKTLPLGRENGTNIISSILGGFLLLLGARCAGGCTSGQGISGVSHLLVGSFITTACIFVVGSIFAFDALFSSREWFFLKL